jgi:hypothetical protein
MMIIISVLAIIIVAYISFNAGRSFNASKTTPVNEVQIPQAVTTQNPIEDEMHEDDPNDVSDHIAFISHLAEQAKENKNEFAHEKLMDAVKLLEALGPHLTIEEQNKIIKDVSFKVALVLNPQGAADQLADELNQFAQSQRE